MKKSALSAALAGGPAAPSVGPASTPAKLDSQAFPCIDYADVIDGVKPEDAVDAASAGVGALALADVVEIVGSAPTSVLLNGVALVRGQCGGQRGLHGLQQGLSGCITVWARGHVSPSRTRTQADYPINPRRRRAGEETTPDIAASLVGVLALAFPRALAHTHARQTCMFSDMQDQSVAYVSHSRTRSPRASALQPLSWPSHVPADHGWEWNASATLIIHVFQLPVQSSHWVVAQRHDHGGKDEGAAGAAAVAVAGAAAGAGTGALRLCGHLRYSNECASAYEGEGQRRSGQACKCASHCGWPVYRTSSPAVQRTGSSCGGRCSRARSWCS
jgi:hypothetical protein